MPSSVSSATSTSSRASTPDEATATGHKRKRGHKSSKNHANRSSGAKARELLTQEQKSANHRRAEQSRRNECLVRLTTICDELVPGAKGLAKSTEIAFAKTHEHLRNMLLEKKELVQQIQTLGGEVPPAELEAIAVLEEYDALSSDEEYSPKNSEEPQSKDEDGDESAESDGAEDDDDGSDEQEEDAVTAAESLSHMKNGH